MSALSASLAALTASLWQVLALAAGFATVRLATPRPEVRYAAALLTLVLMVAWPAATWVQLVQASAPVAGAAAPGVANPWAWVPVAWAMGATAMLARTLGGLLVLRRWVAQAAAPAPALAAALEALRTRLGTRAVRWAVSARVTVPQTVGFVRPVVFLPVTLLTSLPAADLELLAAHELMHVRRWDFLANLGQALVEAALFFHPAMWWVSRCAREDREYLCDDAVVRALGGARPYAAALLTLEEALAPGALAVPATGGAFVKRVRRLLGAPGNGRSAPVTALPLLAGLLALSACLAVATRPTPAVVAAPPELVPALATFCRDVGQEARRPELAAVSREDLLTVVLGDLGERNPKLEAFITEVSRQPPPERLGTLKHSVSVALGRSWECADLDALWANLPVGPAPAAQ